MRITIFQCVGRASSDRDIFSEQGLESKQINTSMMKLHGLLCTLVAVVAVDRVPVFTSNGGEILMNRVPLQIKVGRRVQRLEMGFG